MSNFIIGKDLIYGDNGAAGQVSSLNDIDDLVAGAILVLDEENNTLNGSTVAADVAKTGHFYILTKTDDGEILKTPPISFEAHHQMDTIPVTAVKQVVDLGNNGAAGSTNLGTPTVGEISEIVIIDRTFGEHQPGKIYRYSHVHVTGDTETTILNALHDAVNADEDRIVNATKQGTTTGLIFTAIENETNFIVKGAEALANATITADGTNGTALYVAGKGNIAELEKLYAESNIQDGQAYSGGQKHFWWKRTDSIPASGSYRVWTFETMSYARLGVPAVMPVQNLIVHVALPHNATNSVDDTFAAILAAAMDRPSTASGSSAAGVDDAVGSVSGV